MDFESAKQYLESFISYERFAQVDYSEKNFDLSRFSAFLEEYAVDFSKLKYVHVAGSKGKGTVCRMVSEYLWKEGFSVGRFTSPHLFSVCERFWVDGNYILEDQFAEYVKDLYDFFEKRGRADLTYFELLTVIAFRFFIDQGVDYVVLEVGLGGRLDSTNVVVPCVAALTMVEEEHKGILGNNLSEIIDEKLGIWKEGVPFVVGPQGEEARKLIKEKMKGKEVVFVESSGGAWEKNVAVSREVLVNLLGVVDENIFGNVVDNLQIPGHFDLHQIGGKTVIFDVAHTKESVRDLIGQLEEFRAKNSLGAAFVFLVSLMKGKDVKGILDLIDGVAEKIIFTSSNKERGYTGQELQKMFSRPQGLFEEVLSNLQKNEILIVMGSHFLLAKTMPH